MCKMAGCCAVLGSQNFSVALLIFLTTFVGIGSRKALLIYFQGINGQTAVSSNDLQLATILFNVFAYLPAPLVAVLYQQRPLRRVMLICGSCLIPFSIMMTSFVSKLGPLRILMSICGLGNCILLTTASITLSNLASQHFNLIYSISTCGIGMGIVSLSALTVYLGECYGWRGGTLVLGALVGNIIPCAAAVRFSATSGWRRVDNCRPGQGDVVGEGEGIPGTSCIRGVVMGEEEESDSDSSVSDTSRRESHPLIDGAPSCGVEGGRKSTTLKGTTEQLDRDCELPNGILRRIVSGIQESDFYTDPAFNFFFIAMFLVSLGYCGWHSLIVPNALERGFNVQENLILLSFSAAVGGISGRVVVGLLCDNRFSPVTVYLVCTVLDIASLLCDVFLSTLYLIIVATCIRAGTIGGRAILGTLAARERASLGKKDVVFATGPFCMGIGTLLGDLYSDKIPDITSSYDVTWWLVAGIFLEIVIFITVLVPLIVQKR
ncbi:uncharacterized protein LOC121417435 isoform X1 [Lytechinus variegatus]|uniref:uncharacterized protein LOC121417435 isoform X1 n=1 Tax=Lytechinus variegatus TaxID=7654 RepID=UPI001BB14615|nr:uncharacterized protein LOC121417435 isoform X1 [Lytechinus variegatus]